MLSRFHLIPERHGQTEGRMDGHTDRQTDLLYQYRASVVFFKTYAMDLRYVIVCVYLLVTHVRSMQ